MLSKLLPRLPLEDPLPLTSSRTSTSSQCNTMQVRKLNSPTGAIHKRRRHRNNSLPATILSLSSRRVIILKDILSRVNTLMDLMGLQLAIRAACLALSSKLVPTLPTDLSSLNRIRTIRPRMAVRLDL